MKFNCDGALMVKLNFGVAAFVARDSCGNFIDGRSEYFPCSSSFMAEAKAIKLVIDFASLRSLSRVIIESDCKVVIDVIRGSSSFVEWDLIGILNFIALLTGTFEVIEFAFASRSANRVAHWLVFHEKNAILLKDWFSNIPLELSNILLSDFEAAGIG